MYVQHPNIHAQTIKELRTPGGPGNRPVPPDSGKDRTPPVSRDRNAAQTSDFTPSIDLTAPSKPGTYATNWQLQAPNGRRFSPILWLRAIVEGDAAGLPTGTLSYKVLGFKNSVDNFDNMLPGRQFSAAWTLSNSGTRSWSGDFQVTYVDHDSAGSPQTVRDPMGAQQVVPLRQLTGRELINPGETAVIRRDLIAPARSGRLYRSRWQLRDPEGLPFAFLFEELTVVPATTIGTNVRHSSMTFVADHTIVDGTPLVAGSDFHKQWLVRNSGARQWGNGFRLVFIEGDLNMARGSASHVVPEAKPGEEVIRSIPMTAPPALKRQPTSYNSLWRLQDDRGNVFGHPVTARIVSTTAVTDTITQETALARLLNDPSLWYSQTDPQWAKQLVGHGQKTELLLHTKRQQRNIVHLRLLASKSHQIRLHLCNTSHGPRRTIPNNIQQTLRPILLAIRIQSVRYTIRISQQHITRCQINTFFRPGHPLKNAQHRAGSYQAPYLPGQTAQKRRVMPRTGVNQRTILRFKHAIENSHKHIR
jgi:hypothetical protein